MESNNKFKINFIQDFRISAERAGYYAQCIVRNMENNRDAMVLFAAPIESVLSNEDSLKNIESYLRELGSDAMYEFLSTEDFSNNKIFYFEWMVDNKFHKLDTKPEWVD